MIGTFEQLRDKSCVQRVPGAIRPQAAEHRLPDEREIPEQVENLMPNELIRISQRSLIEHAILRQHDGILQRSPSYQTRRLQGFDFMIETESPRRSDKTAVILRSDLHFKFLIPNERMLEPYFVFQAQRVGGVD